ncbi:MAG: glycosyltransferase family 2 protein, partial [Chthonomonadales bacterium]
DERLLPIEEWQRILKPFDIHELRYYGDNCVEQNEHILAVLKGNPAATSQKNKSSFRVSRFKSGISAIVHTRNEEHNITECLQSLTGWTDQIIVCDMESSDRTRELAAEIVGEDNVMSHPVIKNFDRARNASATRAEHEWVFYLDADERVPPQMGEAILKMIEDRGDAFSGMLVPFRHIFAGHWMQCLYPGYTAPRLFKNGCFFFNPRPHSGAQVDGEIVMFPGDDPNVSLLHNSFTSLSHYLGKLDNYTTSEAANMHRDGHSYSWQNSIRHFVQDFRGYYEQGQATRDGVHGFLYSFLSGFYRFFQHAKLYEHRFRQGQLTAQETNTPANLEEVLQFALNCIHERHVQAPIQIVTSPPSDTEVGVVWTGPLRDPSGYGEESRSLLFSLSQLPLNAGESDGSPNLIVAAQTVPWSFDTVDLSGESGASLLKLEQTTVPEGFIQIIQDLPQSLVGRINDKAGITIARTMFETDRLPDEWVKSLNKFDFVWATSEHGRDAFANSGVHPAKLRVVPGAIDLGQFAVEHSKSSAGKRTATNVRGKCFNSSRFSTGHYTRAGIAFLRVSFKNLTQIQMSG